MTARRIFTQATIIGLCIIVGFGSVSAGEFFFGGGIASRFAFGNTTVIHSQTSENYLSEYGWSREPLSEAPLTLDHAFQIGLFPEIGYRFSPKFAMSVGTSVYLPTNMPSTPTREYPGVDTREGEDIQRNSLRSYGGNRTWSASLLAHWYRTRAVFVTVGASLITYDAPTKQATGELDRQLFGNADLKVGRAFGLTVGFGHEHTLTSHSSLVGRYRYTYAWFSHDDVGYNVAEQDGGGFDIGFSLRYYPSPTTEAHKNVSSQSKLSSINNRLFFGFGYTAFGPTDGRMSWPNSIVSGMRLTGGWKFSNRTSVTVSYNRSIPKADFTTSTYYPNTGLPNTSQNQAGTIFGGTGINSPDRKLLVRSWQANAEVKLLYGFFVQTGIDFITQTIEGGSTTTSIPLTSLLGGLGYERAISQKIGWVTSAGYSLPIESKGVALVDNEGITFQTQLRFYR